MLFGGRIELSIGAAGAAWDAIESMGGRRLSPGQSIVALEEAVTIIRGLWETTQPNGLTVEGIYHSVRDAQRGLAPAHCPGVWIGSYEPRILRATGRMGDG